MIENNKEYILPFRNNEGGIANNEYIGNPRTAERKAQIRGKNGQQVMEYSFRKIAALGVGIRIAGQANEVVGSFTGRKMRQKQRNDALRLGTMALGAAYFGGLGIVYAGAQIGYQYLNHSISVNNENLKSENMRRKSLNNTTSMSRMGGDRT